LHGAGNVFVRRLQPGQTILVKPTALLFKDSTVAMQLHIEHPGNTWRSWRSWGERYIWLRLWGPGRVAVQSAFKQMEENANSLSGASTGTTRHQWEGHRTRTRTRQIWNSDDELEFDAGPEP